MDRQYRNKSDRVDLDLFNAIEGAHELAVKHKDWRQIESALLSIRTQVLSLLHPDDRAKALGN